jgi:hypothetical protein
VRIQGAFAPVVNLEVLPVVDAGVDSWDKSTSEFLKSETVGGIVEIISFGILKVCERASVIKLDTWM